jgi:hypothetical protein
VDPIFSGSSSLYMMVNLTLICCLSRQSSQTYAHFCLTEITFRKSLETHPSLEFATSAELDGAEDYMGESISLLPSLLPGNARRSPKVNEAPFQGVKQSWFRQPSLRRTALRGRHDDELEEVPRIDTKLFAHRMVLAAAISVTFCLELVSFPIMIDELKLSWTYRKTPCYHSYLSRLAMF